MIPFPNKKYNVIYADPPWKFKTFSLKGLGKPPEQHYFCMDLKHIKALPVADIAAKNCVLLMWTTDPFLEKALSVIKCWGFIYKTVGFVWAKTNRKSMGFFRGCGYWTRANPEYCLLATRRKPKRIAKDVDTLVVDRIREHSRKPDRIHNDIERLVNGPYIELFARQTRPGWDAWGLETTKFDGI